MSRLGVELKIFQAYFFSGPNNRRSRFVNAKTFFEGGSQMKTLILALAMVAAGAAQANTSRGWICGLAYQGEAKGVQVVFGNWKMEASGTLKCEAADGEKRELPVLVKTRAKAIRPILAAGKFQIFGASANIALLTHEPEDLLGNYYIAQAQAAVVGGVGVIAGTHVNADDITLYVSVNAIKGAGFHVGVSKMSIELDRARLQ